MVEDGTMVPIPVYLDSPLAARVTEVFRRFSHLFNQETRARLERGDDPFAFPGLTVVAHTGESRALHHAPGPKVIIAGAGMSGGGRIRAHELAFLPQKSTRMLFVGYQTPGSLGRRIADGEKKVRIDGEWVRVRAHISALSGYSGHADREQLLSYVEGAGDGLERTFVAMGEPRSSLFFAQRVKDFLGVEASVPQYGEHAELEL
jgi:metallo-beta-lactamase family protein